MLCGAVHVVVLRRGRARQYAVPRYPSTPQRTTPARLQVWGRDEVNVGVYGGVGGVAVVGRLCGCDIGWLERRW